MTGHGTLNACQGAAYSTPARWRRLWATCNLYCWLDLPGHRYDAHPVNVLPSPCRRQRSRPCPTDGYNMVYPASAALRWVYELKFYEPVAPGAVAVAARPGFGRRQTGRRWPGGWSSLTARLDLRRRLSRAACCALQLFFKAGDGIARRRFSSPGASGLPGSRYCALPLPAGHPGWPRAPAGLPAVARAACNWRISSCAEERCWMTP